MDRNNVDHLLIGVCFILNPFYDAWGRFKRLSKQRNALLKTATSYRELSYWDQELALLAENIDQWRRTYVEQMKVVAEELCRTFYPSLILR